MNFDFCCIGIVFAIFDFLRRLDTFCQLGIGDALPGIWVDGGLTNGCGVVIV